MLGLKTMRNRYLAALAIALLLLPVFWAPSHFHRGSAHRANCAVCLLATMSLSVLTAGTAVVFMALNRREIFETPTPALARVHPRFLGRAPPPCAGL